MLNSDKLRLWRLSIKCYNKRAINRLRLSATLLVIVENATLWAPNGLIETELLESHPPGSLLRLKLLKTPPPIGLTGTGTCRIPPFGLRSGFYCCSWITEVFLHIFLGLEWPLDSPTALCPGHRHITFSWMPRSSRAQIGERVGLQPKRGMVDRWEGIISRHTGNLELILKHRHDLENWTTIITIIIYIQSVSQKHNHDHNTKWTILHVRGCIYSTVVSSTWAKCFEKLTLKNQHFYSHGLIQSNREFGCIFPIKCHLPR